MIVLSKAFAFALIVSVCWAASARAAQVSDWSNIGSGFWLERVCPDSYQKATHPTQTEITEYSECMSYIIGISAGLKYAWQGGTRLQFLSMYPHKLPANEADIVKQLVPFIYYCPPSNVNYLQAMLVVSKYLQNHPEKLEESGAKLVSEALHSAWPCAG